MEESAVSSYICMHCGNVSISLCNDDPREQICNNCGMNDFDTKKLSAWSTQKLQLSIERISDTDKSISTLGECLICKPT